MVHASHVRLDVLHAQVDVEARAVLSQALRTTRLPDHLDVLLALLRTAMHRVGMQEVRARGVSQG
jgi:hypothetical protein